VATYETLVLESPSLGMVEALAAFPEKRTPDFVGH
jgi:hypothetical protein